MEGRKEGRVVGREEGKERGRKGEMGQGKREESRRKTISTCFEICLRK